MHSVRIELAKLVSVGTRITYQATGDAGGQILRLNILEHGCTSCIRSMYNMISGSSLACLPYEFVYF